MGISSGHPPTRQETLVAWSPANALAEAKTAGMLSLLFLTVLRIHDILVWIRIRIWIRGFMPLNNESGSDPDLAIFVIDLQDANKKLFFKNVCLLLFKVHLHYFSKIKSLKKSQKVEIKVFLIIFDW